MFEYFKRHKDFKKELATALEENKALKKQSKNYYIKIRNLYENKKLQLLNVHRDSNIKEQTKLIHEINALNEIIKVGEIDENNLDGTLFAYPNYK